MLIQTNQLKEAEDDCKSNNVFQSGPPGTQMSNGKIKFKNGDKNSAIKFIQQHARIISSNGSVYHDLGNLCIEIEEYNMAIELLEKYLKVSPVDITAITNIATCYARLGKLEPALFGFQVALKLDPHL